MIKIAFFDIDGTLVGFKTHKVAASSWRAMELMRERGIKVVIASGRSMAEMHEELKGKFDAYVTMNGQLCFDAVSYTHLDVYKRQGSTLARRRTSGRANMRRVGPWAMMRPHAMTASEVAKSLTTSMSWQTMTTAAPARARSRTVSITVMHSR